MSSVHNPTDSPKGAIGTSLRKAKSAENALKKEVERAVDDRIDALFGFIGVLVGIY